MLGFKEKISNLDWLINSGKLFKFKVKNYGFE